MLGHRRAQLFGVERGQGHGGDAGPAQRETEHLLAGVGADGEGVQERHPGRSAGVIARGAAGAGHRAGELVEQQVGVRAGHALGRAGGARGVDDLGQVAGLGRYLERPAVVAAVAAAQLLDRHRPRGPGHRPQQVGRRHRAGGPAVAQYLVELRAGEAGADGDGNGTGPVYGGVAGGVVGPAGGVEAQRHPVAPADAAGRQSSAQGIGAPVPLAVGEGGAPVHPQGDGVRVLHRPPAEQVGQEARRGRHGRQLSTRARKLRVPATVRSTVEPMSTP